MGQQFNNQCEQTSKKAVCHKIGSGYKPNLLEIFNPTLKLKL